LDNISKYVVDQLVDNALNEDLSYGDPTTDILINDELRGKAAILAKSSGILCGSYVVTRVFNKVDPSLEIKWVISDGDFFVGADEQLVAEISGSISSILKAERTAINFLQHLSGIATETKAYVDAVSEYKSKILDTRKTVPGLRQLQKYAVGVGGGKNHRKNLSDGILIKDNHVNILAKNGFDLNSIILKALENSPNNLKVEVEVSTLAEVGIALNAGADIIMLDNMEINQIKEAVKIINGKAITEASGGINLENVSSVAQTGVDFISVGALTHSVYALDYSLEIL
jgi:nicotinate-nucleotide pyrophosphorylase (carboxylating)